MKSYKKSPSFVSEVTTMCGEGRRLCGEVSGVSAACDRKYYFDMKYAVTF